MGCLGIVQPEFDISGLCTYWVVLNSVVVADALDEGPPLRAEAELCHSERSALPVLSLI